MNGYKLRRIAVVFGIPAAAAILTVVQVFCLFSGAKKAVEEQAMDGFYSADAVFFEIAVDHEVDLKSLRFVSVGSVSYLDSDMEEDKSEHIKRIIYFSSPVLPPYGGAPLEADLWNAAGETVCYAGKELFVEEDSDGEARYLNVGEMKIYRVIGRLGLRHFHTYLDGMIYLPFDGTVTPAHAQTVFAAEGGDREDMERELLRLNDEEGVSLRLVERKENGRFILDRRTLLILTAFVCAVGFVYLCYLLFKALTKELRALHLFGNADMRLIFVKSAPILFLIPAVFLAGALFTALYEPYLFTAFLPLWLAGVAAVTGELAALVLIGRTALSKVRKRR